MFGYPSCWSRNSSRSGALLLRVMMRVQDRSASTNMIQHIDVADLIPMLRDGGVDLLDVRTDSEVAHGFIEGAGHIPLHLLPSRVGELDARRTLVVYCQSGGRSAQACAWLQTQGFSDVHNLAGGITAWQREGNVVTVTK